MHKLKKVAFGWSVNTINNPDYSLNRLVNKSGDAFVANFFDPLILVN